MFWQGDYIFNRFTGRVAMPQEKKMGPPREHFLRETYIQKKYRRLLEYFMYYFCSKFKKYTYANVFV